jgi:tetratricopeptide (TPR) repeat protein
VAAFGAGTRERSGPQAALEFMQNAKPLQLDDPVHVDVLAAIVDDFAAIKKARKGVALVETALRKHPESAPVQAVAGRAFALNGQSDRAREAFERALELDPENARALVGRARLHADAGERGSRGRALCARNHPRCEGSGRRAGVRGATRDDGKTRRRRRRFYGRVLEDHPYEPGAARALAGAAPRPRRERTGTRWSSPDARCNSEEGTTPRRSSEKVKAEAKDGAGGPHGEQGSGLSRASGTSSRWAAPSQPLLPLLSP